MAVACGDRDPTSVTVDPEPGADAGPLLDPGDAGSAPDASEAGAVPTDDDLALVPLGAALAGATQSAMSRSYRMTSQLSTEVGAVSGSTHYHMTTGAVTLQGADQ